MAHLTSFTVENFKRFEHFEMNNIGQFNLIVGDNNVGKTSVLEALLIDEDPEVFRQRLLTVLFKFRQFTDITDSYLSYFVCRNKPDWETNGKKISFDLLSSGQTINIIIDFKDKRQSDTTTGQARIFLFQISNEGKNLWATNGGGDPDRFLTPYIPLFLAYEHRLTKLYSDYVQMNTKIDDELIDHLKSIIPTIKSIIINPFATSNKDNPVLFINRIDTETALPLGFFGDGAIKLFRILIEIAANKGKRLMIDEIDAGVHIQHFYGFWKTIIQFAAKLEVQLFMTTHNWECLQVFKEVLEETEMQEHQEKARCFTLDELPDGFVSSYAYTFEKFEYAIENGIDLRKVVRL
jgi:hypothetical protein